jgi:D-amino-acid dehydrogenase
LPDRGHHHQHAHITSAAALRVKAIVVYRAEGTMDEGVKQMTVLQRHGPDIEVIDAERVAELGPALAPVRDKLVGESTCPTDGTGDAGVLTQKLAQIATELGLDFRYGTPVTGLNIEGGRFSTVWTSVGLVQADAVVVAMAS